MKKKAKNLEVNQHISMSSGERTTKKCNCRWTRKLDIYQANCKAGSQ